MGEMKRKGKATVQEDSKAIDTKTEICGILRILL
jgi:hypothetical protein